MRIEESKLGRLTILRPTHRLDDKSSPLFEQSLGRRLKENCRCFVVDLAEIEYMSSAGLRVLIMLSKRLAAAEGSLVLCNLDPRVREVFDVAGLSAVFSIVDSRSAAIRKSSAAAVGPLADLAERLLAGPGEAGSEGPAEEAGPGVEALSEAALALLSSGTATPAETGE